jgi:hypothetical protein
MLSRLSLARSLHGVVELKVGAPCSPLQKIVDREGLPSSHAERYGISTKEGKWLKK